VVQKVQNGWYFFPLHSGYVSFSISTIYSRIGYYLSFLLKGQGRYGWTLTAVFTGLTFIWANRQGRWRKIIDLLNSDWVKVRFLLVSVLYIFYGLLVSGLNFHMARYLLFLFPVLCVLVAFCLIYVYSSLKSVPSAVVVLILLAIPVCYYRGTIFNIDADMSYIDIVASQQKIVEKLSESATPYSVVISDFPVYHGLVDRRTGYSDKNFKNVITFNELTPTLQADYIISASMGNMVHCKVDKSRYHAVREEKTPLAEFILYKNNRLRKISKPDT
jgi:hypothetical protein